MDVKTLSAVIGHVSAATTLDIYTHVTDRMRAQAVEEGLIPMNPAEGCKLPGEGRREMQVLTREEMQRLLIQAKEDGCYELLLLELSAGLRRGELLALQWEDLDLGTGELRISRQVSRVRGKLTVSQPKTHVPRSFSLPRVDLRCLSHDKENTKPGIGKYEQTFRAIIRQKSKLAAFR